MLSSEKRRRVPADAETGAAIPTSWAVRTLQASKIAGVSAYALAKRRRRRFQSAAAIRVVTPRKTSVVEGLAGSFDHAKGALMKVGQIASFMSFALSDDERTALARLQDGATPLPARVMTGLIADELGALPAKLFAEWSPSPFAAASIGQVHRARLHEGPEVAVKVQYPGIDRAFKNDLRNVSLVAALLGVPLRSLDSRSVTAEIRERLLEEIDYSLEARNQQEFCDIYAGNPDVTIPRVFPEFSTRRVLTTELVHGKTFERFAVSATREERNRAARLLFWMAYNSILTHRLFNCDPHPGNYIFCDERVAFLDFGSVRRFAPIFVDAWRKMLRSVVENNRRQFRETVEWFGIAPSGRRFDYDYQFDIAAYLSRPWLAKQPFEFSPSYVSDTLAMLVWRNPNWKRMRVPREMIFLNRLQWGLYAVLARLHAESNWLALMEPLLYA